MKIQAELKKMNIPFDQFTPIRDKEGVSVWRIFKEGKSIGVLKYFNHVADRREIENYILLSSNSIPTLQVLGFTDKAILLKDIKESSYRLGTKEDLDSPKVARLIASWYQALHSIKPQTKLYDENDYFAKENMLRLKDICDPKLAIWASIEAAMPKLEAAVSLLPRVLTYNDFYYTNLVVAKDYSMAFMFDYNLLGQSYPYADIRNVCSSLSPIAAKHFLEAYGPISELEKIIDSILSPLITLYLSYERHDKLCSWAIDSWDTLQDGRLQERLEQFKRL